MALKVVMCQIQSIPGEVGINLNSADKLIKKSKGDMFVFPELFLTGYIGKECQNLKDEVNDAIKKLESIAKERDVCIVVGAPSYCDDKLYNSLYFIGNETSVYHKMNLPSFGVFSEKDSFDAGSDPVIAEYQGMKFGLSVCYDLYFPELYRYYAMKGVDSFICLSAAPITSEPFFTKVLPARCVENTTYMIFVNKTGIAGGLPMAGRSVCISPIGKNVGCCGKDPAVLSVAIDPLEIKIAREKRPTVSDVRDDINWY